MGRDDGVGTQTGANGTPGTAEERLQRGNGKREDRTKKGMQTGANSSPHGVDNRHKGDLRIIHCDEMDTTQSKYTRGNRRTLKFVIHIRGP